MLTIGALNQSIGGETSLENITVIERLTAELEATKKAVQQNYSEVCKRQAEIAKLHQCMAIYDEAVDELTAENAALKAFAHGILKDWPDCSCDGFDIQELGQKTGVLVGTEVTESCGEGCNCAEYDGFPLTCYRVAEFIACASHQLA